MRKVNLLVFSVVGCLFLVGSFGILALGQDGSPDQELTYSTFLGNKNENHGGSIVVDDEGYVYSAHFLGGGVAKLNPFGISGGDFVEWSSLPDAFRGGIALDTDNVYVVGRRFIDDWSIFVAKFGKGDGSLAYETTIGKGSGLIGLGNNVDIAVNSESGVDYVYVTTGKTDDPGFFSKLDDTWDGTPHSGANDAFVAKFEQMVDSTTGEPLDPPLKLVYGTFIGGSGGERGHGIAVDASGCAYITGMTSSLSTSFPTSFPINGYQTELEGPTDAFVAKLDSIGDVIYFTYLGGYESMYEEEGFDIAIDNVGNAYVTGQIMSQNGSYDGFLAVFDPAASNGVNSLLYFSYLGGTSYDMGFSIALDESDKAYVFGGTFSSDFPTTENAFDTSYNGQKYDTFLAVLDPSVTGPPSFLSSTYFGGEGADKPRGLALHTTTCNSNNIISAYMSGETSSRKDFPITPGAYDETYNGGKYDGFLSILAFGDFANPPTVTILSPSDGSTFASGALINFVGSAVDIPDGDLTGSLVWYSDKDGHIGTGGNFST
nr:hypothetical protein [Candidatus Aenigmarchaeota archaeon]